MYKFIVIGLFMASPFSFAREIDDPCKKIEDACKNAGFSVGLAAQGKGLGINCISNLMGSDIGKKPSIPLPVVSSDVISECRKRHPEFGQAPKPKVHTDKMLWSTLIEDKFKREFCDVPAIKECFKVSRSDCIEGIGPIVDQCGKLLRSELPADFDSTKQGPMFIKRLSICIDSKYLTQFQDRLIKSNNHCIFNKTNSHSGTK